MTDDGDTPDDADPFDVGPYGTVWNVIGAYYHLRNAIVVPNAAPGGVRWQTVSPEVTFTVASIIGLVGTGDFLLAGTDFEAYRQSGR